MAAHQSGIRKGFRRVHPREDQRGRAIRGRGQSPDFSQDAAQVHLDESRPRIQMDTDGWQARLRGISAVFRKHADVYTSYVMLTTDSNRSYLATSEGAALIRPSAMS